VFPPPLVNWSVIAAGVVVVAVFRSVLAGVERY